MMSSDAVITYCATIAGKPLRFYSVSTRTFVEFEQFSACVGFSRQGKRRHLRKMRSTRWREKVAVTVIDGVELTLAPKWMAEAIVGHGRKYGWLSEDTANDFDVALAEAETIAQQERQAA